jgi:catechol 2,3-dioxygenase-like lactoylglutathione lyase family enzyme
MRYHRTMGPVLFRLAARPVAGCLAFALTMTAAQPGPTPSARPQVHHILLEVTDLGRAIAFYRDQFGFRESHRHDDFAMLEGGNLALALWQSHFPWEKPRPSERGSSGMYPHLALPDVRAKVQQLRTAGARIVQEPKTYDWGTEAFVADPDGYVWALISSAANSR